MYREDAHEDRSLLLVGAEGAIVAFRRHDGHLAWRKDIADAFAGPLEFVIHGGRIFVGTLSRIVCLDYASGVTVGEVLLTEPDAFRGPTFLVDGEHLYVVAREHTYCMTHDGRMLWKTPHGLPLQCGPTLAFPGNARPGDART